MNNMVQLNHSYSLDQRQRRNQEKVDYYKNLQTQTQMRAERDRLEKLMGGREQKLNGSMLGESQGNKTVGFIQQPGAAPRISPLKAAFLGR